MNERGIEWDRGWKDGGVSWTTSNRLVPEIFYSAGTEVETEIEWSSEQPDSSSFYLLQFNARWLTCPWTISGITEVLLRLISCQCDKNNKIKVYFGCSVVAILMLETLKKGVKLHLHVKGRWSIKKLQNLISLAVCVGQCTSKWLNNRISEPSYR